MNSIRSKVFWVVAMASACALAVPRVDENSVTMEQAENPNRTVTISYVLTGEPGIVTFDVETNVTGTVVTSQNRSMGKTSPARFIRVG